MADEEILYRFKVRGGTASALSTVNEIPLSRELVVETDTRRLKLGDGVKAFNDLPYAVSSSTIHTVAAAPTEALGNDGDYAIWPSTSAPLLYGPKAAGAWPPGVPLKGGKGDTGAAGSAWLRGAGVPSAALGVNGDYYLHTGTDDVYAKAAGSWSVVGNFRGAPGPRGDEGLKGDPGVPGPSSSCFPTANFDGGTGVIAVGAWAEVYLPFGFTIRGWTLGGDVLGTLSIDIRVAPFADYPPDGADSICGTNPPTLAGDNKARSSTLTGWSVDVPSGSFLRFYVAACAGINKATLTLEGERT